jgi:hypothetical protein
MRQLNLEVSSHLSGPFYSFENVLLYLIMLLFLGTLERIMKYLERGVKVKETSKDIQVKRDA